MSAPPRPKEEVEAMKAMGWDLDHHGDYVKRIDRRFYWVLAPYWDEMQQLCGRRKEWVWTFERNPPCADLYFDTPEAFAVWFAVEHANSLEDL